MNRYYNENNTCEHLAPIALFIFNRSDHLTQTLESLRQCHGFDESDIYVFADGPRTDSDIASVEKARAVAKGFLGDRAHYRFSESNKGLAASIIAGVSELTERYGRVIVLEDDLEVSPEFLNFMNSALDRYADDDRVKQVSGFNFSVPEFKGMDHAMFFPLTTTWGWGTWNRAWKELDPDAKGWREALSDPSLRKRFNLNGAYDYTGMLERQMSGKCDSWGIRWYWSVFQNDGLVCYPPQTLVRNIGMDGTGTHGRGWLNRFRNEDLSIRSNSVDLSSSVRVKPDLWSHMCRSIWWLNGGWMGRLISSGRRLVRLS